GRTLVAKCELIVSRDGTVGTVKFAAMRRHQGNNAGITAKFGQRQRPRRQRMPAVRRLDQAQRHNGVRQLIKVLNQTLDAGIDKPAERITFVALAEDKPWNIVKQA